MKEDCKIEYYIIEKMTHSIEKNNENYKITNQEYIIEQKIIDLNFYPRYCRIREEKIEIKRDKKV